jgi:hypothetical protein
MLYITLGDGPTRTNQPAKKWVNWPTQANITHASAGRRPRASARPRPSWSAPHVLTKSIGSARPDRADAAPIESIDPAQTRSHVTQPIFGAAQSFYYIFSHFAVMNSTILLHWTQLFWCNELNHFTSLNSLRCSVILWYCYGELSHFVILSDILLHWTQSFLLQCLDQPFFYSTQSFCNLFSHFATVNSSIFYGAQLF